MMNKYYKNQKKSLEKKHVKGTKILLKKKKRKVEYMRNYYLAHKK